MSEASTRISQLSVDDLDERAADYLGKLAVGAAEREANRDMPYGLVREFAAARLGTYRVPRELGGPGATARQSFRFVIDLATADANVAQAIRPHLGFVEGLTQFDDAAERERWIPRVLAGDLFGLANGEIGAANGVIRTRAVRDGDNYRISGSKFYSTGCLFADWLNVSAVGEDGEKLTFIVPSDREGIELVDDWDGMGQRLTASGTTNFRDVLAYPHERLVRAVGDNAPRSLVTATQQLVLASVETGIAHNALRDAVQFAQERSRPIKHSSATRSVDDPYIQHAVGEISARAFAARAAVLSAADAIDVALAPDASAADATEAAIAVAQAQFIAVESALKSAELLFDVGGGSATMREHNFDRHWRNARTVANHNPRYYKAGVVGAYRLTGQEPPTTGLF